jgi:predicted GNAT superfamily acetyltransferase
LKWFFLMGFSGSVNHDGSNFGWSGFFWCVFLVLLIMMGQILVEVVFLMGFSGSVNHDGSNFGWSVFSDGFFWFC